MTTCAVCGTTVREGILPEHLAQCRDRKGDPVAEVDLYSSPLAQALSKYLERPALGGTDRRGAEWKRASEDLGYDDLHDARRGQGQHVRDHGSFGSYPVHDDYGDESEP